MSDSDHEWLPMPSGISITTHDSFTTDLLKQFDLKSAELLYSGILLSLDQLREASVNDSGIIESSANGHSKVPPVEQVEVAVKGEHNSNSIIDITATSSNSICTNLSNTQGCLTATNGKAASVATAPPPAENNTSIAPPTLTLNERRSALNLLRKSSMFLKDKLQSTTGHHPNANNATQQPLFYYSLTMKKKKRKDDAAPLPSAQPELNTSLSYMLPTTNSDDIDQVYQTPSSQHYKKVLQSRATISTTDPNHLDHSFDTIFINGIKPPIITHYPPKPLKYSPVEPLPAPDGTEDDFQALDSDTLKKRHINKKKLQRLSLPLLKLNINNQHKTTTSTTTFNIEKDASTTSTPQEKHLHEPSTLSSIQKRKSDSDILNRQQQQQKTPDSVPTSSVFHTLSRQWNKLLSYTTSCKKK